MIKFLVILLVNSLDQIELDVHKIIMRYFLNNRHLSTHTRSSTITLTQLQIKSNAVPQREKQTDRS